MPTANELSEYYEKRYFQESAGLYRNEYNQDELIYFDNKAKVAEYICQKSIGSLLDVGCGEGYFAKYFKEKNWDIKTLDYSNHGISNHNPELLETIINFSFEILKVEKIFSEVYFENERAYILYKRYNFIEIGKKSLNNRKIIIMEL